MIKTNKITDKRVHKIANLKKALFNMWSPNERKGVLRESWELLKSFSELVIYEAMEFVKYIIDNWESCTILTLASIGLSYAIGELPAWITLPAFIETTMVVPIIAILLITLLTFSLKNKAAKTMGGYNVG